MRFLIFSIFFLFNALSQATPPNCLPGSAMLPPDITEVAWANANQGNNFCPRVTYRNNFAAATTLDEIKRITNEQLAAKGLAVNWDAGHDSHATWKAFTADDLARVKRLANIAIQSLKAYPDGFFAKVGVEKIQLIKELDVKDAQNNVTRRAAQPSPRTKTLFFAENNDMPTYCDSGLEYRLHHELFHQIEGKHCGGMKETDPEWANLNYNQHFNYAGGGNLAYQPNFKNLEHPAYGWASEYSQFGQEEDRSEIFAMMMTQGYAERFQRWSSVDDILIKKRRYIENFLTTKVNDPAMNAAFFNSRAKLTPSPSSP